MIKIKLLDVSNQDITKHCNSYLELPQLFRLKIISNSFNDILEVVSYIDAVFDVCIIGIQRVDNRQLIRSGDNLLIGTQLTVNFRN